eukprot:PhF_6_TR31416/c0_g1_i1/m.46055
MFSQQFSSYGFEDMVSRVFADMLIKNRENIDEFIDTLLHNKNVSEGKGPKAGATVRGGPAYIYRDPKITPTADMIKKDSVVVETTRSFVEDLKDRPDENTPYESLFNDAKKECCEAVAKIVKQCKAAGKKFFDAEFYFDRRINMYPEGSPNDCSVGEPTECMRLSEMYVGAPLKSGEYDFDDLFQGDVGDCYLIGAISSLAACNRAMLERLIVAYDIESSVYGVLLYKNGGWEWVIVDDFVPIQNFGGVPTPLYCKSGQSTELWPMILEKAYAKMHNNWDTIDGGWPKEALGDLTGGVERSFDFKTVDKAITFEQFKAWVDDTHVIVSCMIGNDVEQSDAQGNAGEQGAVYGLYHGHAYSVIRAVKTSDGQGFVRVRNPWGNSAEWTGRYSDNSSDWKKNLRHFDELKPEMKADGAFWMLWEDFRKYFSRGDLARFFDEEKWSLLTFHDASNKIVPYILHVGGTEPQHIVISVVQEDPKMRDPRKGIPHTKQREAYSRMKFSIRPLTRAPKNEEELAAATQSRTSGTSVQCNTRSLDHEIKDLAPGIYSIIPALITNNVKGMMIRCFAHRTADVSMWRLGQENKAFSIQGPVGVPPAVVVSNASFQASPSITQQTLEAQVAQMQEEIKRLNGVIKQKDDQMLAQRTASTPATPAPKTQQLTPFERIHFNDVSKLQGAVRQIFDEADTDRSNRIDLGKAVNGIRILVTLGAGFDGQFRTLLKAKGLENAPGITFEQFYDLTVSMINSWKVLQ